MLNNDLDIGRGNDIIKTLMDIKSFRLKFLLHWFIGMKRKLTNWPILWVPIVLLEFLTLFLAMLGQLKIQAEFIQRWIDRITTISTTYLFNKYTAQILIYLLGSLLIFQVCLALAAQRLKDQQLSYKKASNYKETILKLSAASVWVGHIVYLPYCITLALVFDDLKTIPSLIVFLLLSLPSACFLANQGTQIRLISFQSAIFIALSIFHSTNLPKIAFITFLCFFKAKRNPNPIKRGLLGFCGAFAFWIMFTTISTMRSSLLLLCFAGAFTVGAAVAFSLCVRPMKYSNSLSENMFWYELLVSLYKSKTSDQSLSIPEKLELERIYSRFVKSLDKDGSSLNRRIDKMNKEELREVLSHKLNAEIQSDPKVAQRILEIRVRMLGQTTNLLQLLHDVQKISIEISKKPSITENLELELLNTEIKQKYFSDQNEELNTNQIIIVAELSKQYYEAVAKYLKSVHTFWAQLCAPTVQKQTIFRILKTMCQLSGKMEAKLQAIDESCKRPKQLRPLIEAVQKFSKPYSTATDISLTKIDDSNLFTYNTGYIVFRERRIESLSIRFMLETGFKQNDCERLTLSSIFPCLVREHLVKLIEKQGSKTVPYFQVPILNAEGTLQIHTCSLSLVSDMIYGSKFLLNLNDSEGYSNCSCVMIETFTNRIHCVSKAFLRCFNFSAQKYKIYVTESTMVVNELFPQLDLYDSKTMERLKKKQKFNTDLYLKTLARSNRNEKITKINLSLLFQYQISQNNELIFLRVNAGYAINTEKDINKTRIQNINTRRNSDRQKKVNFERQRYFCAIPNPYSGKIAERQIRLTEEKRIRGYQLLWIAYFVIFVLIVGTTLIWRQQAALGSNTWSNLRLDIYNTKMAEFKLEQIASLCFLNHNIQISLLSPARQDLLSPEKLHQLGIDIVNRSALISNKLATELLQVLTIQLIQDFQYNIKLRNTTSSHNFISLKLVSLPALLQQDIDENQSTFVFQNIQFFRAMEKAFDVKQRSIESAQAVQPGIKTTAIIGGLILIFFICLVYGAIYRVESHLFDIICLLQHISIAQIKQNVRNVSKLFSRFQQLKLFCENVSPITEKTKQSAEQRGITGQSNEEDKLMPIKGGKDDEFEFIASFKRQSFFRIIYRENIFIVMLFLFIILCLYVAIRSGQSKSDHLQTFYYQNEFHNSLNHIQSQYLNFYYKAFKSYYKKPSIAITEPASQVVTPLVHFQTILPPFFNEYLRKQTFFTIGNLCSTPKPLSELSFWLTLLPCEKVYYGLLSQGFALVSQRYRQSLQILNDKNLTGFFKTDFLLEETVYAVQVIQFRMRILLDNFISACSEFEAASIAWYQRMLVWIVIASLFATLWMYYSNKKFRYRCELGIFLFGIIPKQIMYKMKMTRYLRQNGILKKLESL